MGALLAAAVALIPAVYLVVRVAEAGLPRILAEVTTPRVAAMAGRTLALVGLVWLGSTILGVTAALLTTRTDAPGRRVFGVLLALPLAVPSYVAAYTWAAIADLWDPSGRFDGFWAAVLVLTLYSYPYVYLTVASALAGQDQGPAEVARSLGEGEWGVLRRVTLPLALPAILQGLNQTVMMALGMVVIASMIGARGVGETVLLGLQRGDAGQGFVGGLAIVLLAVAFDRITQAYGRRIQVRGA